MEVGSQMMTDTRFYKIVAKRMGGEIISSYVDTFQDYSRQHDKMVSNHSDILIFYIEDQYGDIYDPSQLPREIGT